MNKLSQMHQASEINFAIGEIPKAHEGTVFVPEFPEAKNPSMKSIVVDGEIVAIVSDRYKLIQHEEAFRPIID